VADVGELTPLLFGQRAVAIEVEPGDDSGPTLRTILAGGLRLHGNERVVPVLSIGAVLAVLPVLPVGAIGTIAAITAVAEEGGAGRALQAKSSRRAFLAGGNDVDLDVLTIDSAGAWRAVADEAIRTRAGHLDSAMGAVVAG